MKRRFATLATALVVWFLGLGQTLAADRLGTVGFLKIWAYANCGKPVLEEMRGACDPAAVSEAVPADQLAAAHMERARALISFGRLEQAYEATNAALNIEPKRADALVLRARVSMTLRWADQTQRDLNAGLMLAPDDPYLLATNAERLLGMEDMKGALRDISAALKTKPDEPEMLTIRGRVRMQSGQLDAAKMDLDRALEVSPHDQYALLFRAQVHLRRLEFGQSIDDADTLLAIKPHDISVLQVRALANTALNRLSNAVDDLSDILGKPGEVTTASPKMPLFNELLMQRAILLVKLDRRAEASLDLDKIVSTGGKMAILRMQLYLRKNGFADLKLDGERSPAFNKAVETCFINQSCGRGLMQAL